MAFLGDCNDNYFDDDDDDVWDFGDPVSSEDVEPVVVKCVPDCPSQQSIREPHPVCNTANKPKGVHAGRGCGNPRACNTDGFLLVNSKPPGHQVLSPDIVSSHAATPQPSHTSASDIQQSSRFNSAKSDQHQNNLGNTNLKELTAEAAGRAFDGQKSSLPHRAAKVGSNKSASTPQRYLGFGRGLQFRMLAPGGGLLAKGPTHTQLPTDAGQSQQQDGKEGLEPKNHHSSAGQHEDVESAQIWLSKLMVSSGVQTLHNSVPRGSEQVDKRWLQSLEKKWSSMERPKGAAISGMLRKCFSQVVNPYLTALYIIENSKDFHQGKTTTFAFTVAKEFESWALEDKDRYPVCVDQNVKVIAFYVGCKVNMIYLDTLINAFRMKHDGNEYFLQMIQSYLEKKKYKEAAHCVTKLGLQDHFTIKDICLPLIIQDKINLVESYVSNKQNHQVELLKLLDHLVDRNTNLDRLIGSSDVPKVKWDKMTRKIISKLAVRLMKLYQVPQEICPNISNESLLKGMRYLMYKRYIEHGLGTAQWVELIQSTADGNQLVQLELVEQLVSYYDMEEAAKWAKHYDLPLEKLPHQVVPLVANAKSVEDHSDKLSDSRDTSSYDNTCSRCHHVLKLGDDSIHWIDTEEGFFTCLDHVSKLGLVGIDAEWRPCFGQMTPQRMSLLQLATKTDVFLLDMLKLEAVLSEANWTRWAEAFFSKKDIIKVGYCIEGDLQMMVRMLPFIREPLNEMKSLVDLQKLYINVCKACPTAFDETCSIAEDESNNHDKKTTDNVLVVKSEERGLSDLVRLCLGKPLDKQQQMSDWEKRPLRPKQMKYAALDAYCLLEVYDVLVKKIKQLGLAINIESTLSYKTKPRKTKMERKQQKVAEKPDRTGNRVQMPPNPPAWTGPPISPRQLKVVCDNMLQGLGRYLRCCGVDVHILDNEDLHDKCAVISRNENRIILTSGTPFIMLRNQVPSGYCYNVGPGKARDQVRGVLNHFNVEVSSGDIFTRCQVCNGDHYLIVAPAEMQQAWIRKMSSLGHCQEVNSKPSKSSSTKADFKSKSLSPKNNQNCTTQESFANSDYDIIFDHIDLDTLTVGPNHVPLLVEALPKGMLNKVTEFYVCATCGKVFWEGGHFTRVREQFSDIIKSDMPGSYLENLLKGRKRLK